METYYNIKFLAKKFMLKIVDNIRVQFAAFTM